MKISAKTPLSSLQQYHRTAAALQKKTTPILKEETSRKREDRVHLSSHARQLNAAKKILKDIPEIRMDKVEEIKKKMDEGTYSLDGEAIASSLLKETIENERLT